MDYMCGVFVSISASIEWAGDHHNIQPRGVPKRCTANRRISQPSRCVD